LCNRRITLVDPSSAQSNRLVDPSSAQSNRLVDPSSAQSNRAVPDADDEPARQSKFLRVLRVVGIILLVAVLIIPLILLYAYKGIANAVTTLANRNAHSRQDVP
jgi:cytochrome c-type biogenesis protein CcmH/NrfG